MKIDEAIHAMQAEKEAGVKDLILMHWTLDMFDIEEIPGKVTWPEICDEIMQDAEAWREIYETLSEMVKYAFWRVADAKRNNIVVEK